MTLQEQLTDIIRRPVGASERARAALHLVDWLGCALAGSTSEPYRIARAVFAGSRGDAPLIGGGRASAQDAAYLNGIPGNVLEMDDVHRRAILHPGPTVMPAVLAALNRDTPPALLLDSIVRGYEAVIRVGRALGPAHYAMFHNTATAGPFGTAAGVASMLGLDRAALVAALGNAGTVAAGLWQCRHEPVMTKQLHCAHAAQAGYLAAALARGGFTGPKCLLDGRQGFFAALCKDGDPSAVVSNAHGDWLIHEVSFKPWPACRHAHPVIDAVRLAKAQIGKRKITAIAIGTYCDAITFCDRPEPKTVIDAKFSLQHAAAVALLRETPELADFDPPAIADRKLATLRALTLVTAAEPFAGRYPGHFGAGVEITLADGDRIATHVDDALGDPENPLSEATLIAKARTLMTFAGVTPDAGARLIKATLGLPTSKTTGPFRSALSTALTNPTEH